MRTIFFLLLTLTALAFPDKETVAGQSLVQKSLVTWTTGANTGRTRIMFLGNNVYLDTSSTSQVGSWKRIDNTADSCSQPFPIATDTNGSTRPVWEYRLWELVRSVDKDSSTHVYRIQTRERVYNGTTRTPQWTPWTIKGANNGYADVTVQDSILIGNIGVTTKASQYALGFVAGSWARLCPDDVAATANAATDSIFADSLMFFVR